MSHHHSEKHDERLFEEWWEREVMQGCYDYYLTREHKHWARQGFFAALRIDREKHVYPQPSILAVTVSD